MKNQLQLHLEALEKVKALQTIQTSNSLSDSVLQILTESDIDLKFSSVSYTDSQKTQVINKLSQVAETLAAKPSLENFKEYSFIVTTCARKIVDEDRSLTFEMINLLNDIYKKCQQ